VDIWTLQKGHNLKVTVTLPVQQAQVGHNDRLARQKRAKHNKQKMKYQQHHQKLLPEIIPVPPVDQTNFTVLVE
jgi:hypothetical protein